MVLSPSRPSVEASAIRGITYSNYHPGGRQVENAGILAGLDEEMQAIDSGSGEGSRMPVKAPWMAEQELLGVVRRLHPDMTMLEYGSGRSTEYFARLVRNYCSIEHDAGWHDKVKPRAEVAGVRLLCVPPLWPQSEPFAAALPGQFAGYVEAWREFGNVFDAVLIDGRARVDAAISVAEGLKPGGLLFFHDFFSRERYWKRLPELERFYRLVDSVRDTEQTLAVFERR